MASKELEVYRYYRYKLDDVPPERLGAENERLRVLGSRVPRHEQHLILEQHRPGYKRPQTSQRTS